MQRDDLNRLIHQAQAGDEHAMDALLAYALPLIERYLRGRIRSVPDREDVAQEILLRVARALPHTTLTAPFEHWVMRIASNCVRTYYQRAAARHELSLDDLTQRESELQREDSFASLIERIAQEQRADQMKDIIRRVCSDAERRVLWLCAQGESCEAVAQMLDMNANTVRSHLLRARAKVLAYLVQHQPHLLGGRERIAAAIQRAQQEASPAEQLTEAEMQALVAMPPPNQTLLRKACLKIARFLTME